MTPHDIAWMACNRHAAMQKPDELAAVLERAIALNPSVIVEIGCMAGGTLYAWREICDEVYGITLPPPNPDYPKQHGASVLLGDSHEQAAIDWLREALAGRPIDVLHIDGDHSYDGVRADWEMYSPLVRPGGLILIHDVANSIDAPDVGSFWRQELEIQFNGTVVSFPGRRPIGFGIITKEIQ